MVPPESMPNSEVKRSIADGSVGSPHVRVGQCQVFIRALAIARAFLLLNCHFELNEIYAVIDN